ncbi:MAG: hypothetical protein D6830_01910 [Ignavibacteria bacterium]|nr:MAG: hypothetical protein D6830_01910 [Ignavibacteria bacterium]
MDYQTIIPSPDAIALPAPYWLFKLLLVLTFVLHIVAMNILVGGSFIAVVTKFRQNKNQYFDLLFKDITKKLPNFMAATITLGIAPLLFLQVIYGQYFYTSSVIIGWSWFSVLIILVLAYYGLYLVSFKNERLADLTKWILSLSLLFFFIIGFIYSNNITLMLKPEYWAQKYFNDPTGHNLNLGEHSLIARYLHFMVAAVSIGGLLVALIGVFKKGDDNYAGFLRNFGLKWFANGTMVQVVVGIIFLMMLPKLQMKLFMGGDVLATILFVVSIVITAYVITAAIKGSRSGDNSKAIYISSVFTFVLILLMAIMRDILRDSYLSGYFNSSQFTISTQWEVLPLFLVLFIAGLALWYKMLKRYFQTSN